MGSSHLLSPLCVFAMFFYEELKALQLPFAARDGVGASRKLPVLFLQLPVSGLEATHFRGHALDALDVLLGRHPLLSIGPADCFFRQRFPQPCQRSSSTQRRAYCCVLINSLHRSSMFRIIASCSQPRGVCYCYFVRASDELFSTFCQP